APRERLRNEQRTSRRVVDDPSVHDRRRRTVVSRARATRHAHALVRAWRRELRAAGGRRPHSGGRRRDVRCRWRREGAAHARRRKIEGDRRARGWARRHLVACSDAGRARSRRAVDRRIAVPAILVCHWFIWSLVHLVIGSSGYWFI